MPETTVNPAIESSLWAYQVSPLLLPEPLVIKTDAYILCEGDRRRQARRHFPQGSCQTCMTSHHLPIMPPSYHVTQLKYLI